MEFWPVGDSGGIAVASEAIGIKIPDTGRRVIGRVTTFKLGIVSTILFSQHYTKIFFKNRTKITSLQFTIYILRARVKSHIPKPDFLVANLFLVSMGLESCPVRAATFFMIT